jgi:hypothetical protein
MKTAELTCEELPVPLPRPLMKKQANHSGKKRAPRLKDLPPDLKKKEASKPLYLIRYE